MANNEIPPVEPRGFGKNDRDPLAKKATVPEEPIKPVVKTPVKPAAKPAAKPSVKK